jgi:ATP:ADP antiporter, AAA family
MRKPSLRGSTRPAGFAGLSDELRLTLLLFLLSFFGLGLPRIYTSNAAHTIFIDTYGPEFIPYAYIAQAVFIPLFGYLYMKADARLSLRRLVIGSMALDILVLLAMWSGFTFTKLGPMAFVGMIWFEIEFVLCSLWLWGTATQLLDLRQGKRLFGYISAGEPLAIILGGLATPFALRFLATKDLLLFSAAGVFVAICVVLYITTHHSLQRETADPFAEETPERPAARPWYAERYVQVLVGIVIISQFGYYFTDTVFYLEASARYPDEQALGAFLGTYMACVGIVSLISSLFVSGPLLTRFGLRGALLLLPVLLVVSAAVGTAAGFGFAETAALFWIVFIMKTMDQSIRYTVDKTASVTLYQPLPAAQRMQVQTALESIIEPLVGGVCGLLLALLLQVLGFGSHSIVMAIVIVAVAWALLVLVQDRYYRRALRLAMNARRLGTGQMSIEDPEAIGVIVEALASDAPGRVINALGLIEKIEGFDRPACYQRLLAHPAAPVRYEVMRQIEALGPGAFDPARIKDQAERETEPALRAMAVRTLATADPANATNNLTPLLDAGDEPVRREAFVGLLRHGGIEGILRAGEPLLSALRSEDPAQRRFAARVIESARVSGFTNELTLLLLDADSAVRSAALRAVGGAKTQQLWPHAVQLLCDPHVDVRNAAADAIARSGDAALEPLTGLLGSADADRTARRRAARVLGAIGSAAARRRLLQHLAVAERTVGEAVLFALRPAPGLDPEERGELRDHQALLIDRAVRTTAWRAALDAAPPAGIEPVLRRALSDQLEIDLKSLFHVLALLHPEADMADAWSSYRSDDAARRAITIEATETLLGPDVRAAVLALLEHGDDQQCLSALPADYRQRTHVSGDVARTVFDAPASLVTPWTRAAALYTLIKSGRGVTPRDGLATADPLCVELIGAETSMTRDQSGERSMLTIEKVLILRNTPIFDSVKEEQLVDVAERAEPIELGAGTTLFERGQAGHTMYVVVEGRIKAHIGDKTLAELGPHDVVGEMAALDPEPRSASVTALEPTLLLRISNQNLQLLIDHNPDVARGIIKVLCARLRDAGAKAVGAATMAA